VLLLVPRFRVVAALALSLLGVAVLAIEGPGSIDVTVHYGLFRCLTGFFLGCLTFRAYRVTALKLGGQLPRVSLAEGACVALVLAFLAVAGTGPLSFLAPLVFVATVFIFAFEGGAVSRFMKHAALLRLGALSYSIYMVHAFVLLILENSTAVAGKVLGIRLETDRMITGHLIGLLDFGNLWVMDGVAMVYLAAVIALASVTYRYVEVPGYDAVKRFVNRQSRPAMRAPHHEVCRG
jgi:peptidoglycan/LPS O-acetylase OafA/YrhL